MPGTVNPDGTVQVAPPTRSAFAPQAVQPAPAAQPPLQVSSSPSPDAAGAIRSLIAALAQAFAPKSVTQIKARADQGEAAAQGLGNEFR